MTRQESPPVADLAGLALAAVAATLPPEQSGYDQGWTLDMLPACIAAIRQNPTAQDQRLVAAAATLGLSDAELLTIALCLAVERDARAASAIAATQTLPGGGRPLLGLAAEASACLGGTLVELACGAAVASGFLVIGEEERPLPARSLAVPLPIIAALSGRADGWANVSPLSPPPVPLTKAVTSEAKARGGLFSTRRGAGLVIRSPSRAEAIAAAGVVAGHGGYQLAEVDGDPPPGLAAWLAVTATIPIFLTHTALGDSWTRPRMPHYAGSWIAAPGVDGTILCDSGKDEWVLPVPDTNERVSLWQKSGARRSDAIRAARSFRQGAGRIAEVSSLATLNATRRGEAQFNWDDLAAGIGAGSSGLDKLARRSAARVDAAAMVLPPDLRDLLGRLVERSRVRCTLADTLGPAIRARYRPGVRALMTGESGTGKTLAAHWLAGQLGLPLYRVDMAALTSKWIGETEKNLSAVLGAAEHADVLLFFDEADALFGGRTEVSDAHDRYANAQTNYLLQRIEDFDGIVILASNSRDRFDPAFTRRLDAILNFPMPEAAARRDLWSAHLGENQPLDAALLDRLAVTIDLAGGHIRNIVLAAAARAVSADRSIAWRDLRAAITEEYGKLGRTPPPLEP